ncbi:uncharacterized protein LOC134265366 [Saccostrea cucullata]|uniref:uncharacterized protein LOC134265366 n=1 Tax=Saccostrea cuccullata TaxID=36930 RepID=UPI002ED2E720
MLELRKQARETSSPHSPVSDRRLKVRFRTPSLSPKKTITVPKRDLISIPKESWGAEKPESDLDSSRLDGSSEADSQLKQGLEDGQEVKESESEHSKKGDSLDGTEKLSSHHSSTSLPPVSMETTEKDGDDEVFEEAKVPTPHPETPQPEIENMSPVQSPVETASVKSPVEDEPVENEPIDNEPVEPLVPPIASPDSESETDRGSSCVVLSTKCHCGSPITYANSH